MPMLPNIPRLALVRVCLALAALCCLARPAHAQGASSDVIVCRVFDAARAEYLGTARVTIEGTAISVGAFRRDFYNLFQSRAFASDAGAPRALRTRSRHLQPV